MTGNVNFSVEMTGVEQLTAKFDTIGARLRQELATTMQRVVNKLVNYIQSGELSGQVLHARTGTLRRSIMGIVDNQQDTVTGNVTSRAGGNAPLAYAAIHEYGGVIHIPARQITMYRFMNRQGDIGGLVRKRRSNFATQHEAKAHDITMPARPYFKPALENNREYITQQIDAAISRGTK